MRLHAYQDILKEGARLGGAGPVLPDEIKQRYVGENGGEVIFDVLTQLFNAEIRRSAEAQESFDDHSFKFAATLALEQLGFRR